VSLKTFAAISVGSFELTMKIFEFSGRNTIREIDCLSQNLDLGSETYATGTLSKEKIDELCRTLVDFKEVMKSYRVDAFRAYGTSALRETKNTLIVLDQIAQRTGIEVKILSNSEQRFLDYKSVASKGESFRKIIEEKTAIVDISNGSIQLSLFENDALMSTQNLRLGVLRLQEMLAHLNAGRERMEALVDEYAEAQLAPYKKLYLKDREIRNIIIVDDYISPWAIRRAGNDAGKSTIELEDFESLMDLLHNGGTMGAAKALGIAEEKVPLVMISAVLAKRIAKVMGATKVWAPGVTLCDGMAYEYAEEIKMFRGEHDFERDIIACAGGVSKRYMGSRKRAETLEYLATTIFDSMKKIHGLGKRERLFLQIAALLHDCGKYVSLVDIGERSYEIIMATEIIGLSHAEREIVASVVRYNHSDFTYYGYNESRGADFSGRESYLIIAKLTAILRLANSLDRSHKQKLRGMKAQLLENELYLTIDTQEDISLEKGFFDVSAEFFREVFSVDPILKTKKNF